MSFGEPFQASRISLSGFHPSRGMLSGQLMNPTETHAAHVFLTHHDFVKGVALKYAPRPGLVEDISQQVFLEFMAKESRWDLSKDVRPLLASMTRHVAMRLWRERTRQQPEVVQKLADHIRLLAGEREAPPRYEEELGVAELGNWNDRKGRGDVAIRHLSSAMDEFALYDRVLTDAEIRKLAEQGRIDTLAHNVCTHRVSGRRTKGHRAGIALGRAPASATDGICTMPYAKVSEAELVCLTHLALELLFLAGQRTPEGRVRPSPLD